MELTEAELMAGRALANIILPAGILEYFTIVRVENRKVKVKDGEVWSDIEIHVILDESDNRSVGQKSTWKPAGYTEPTVVQDFPIRDSKVFLHIRRRLWLDENGQNVTVPLDYPFVAKGMNLSPEFAAYLKGTDGKISAECAAAWGLK